MEATRSCLTLLRLPNRDGKQEKERDEGHRDERDRRATQSSFLNPLDHGHRNPGTEDEAQGDEQGGEERADHSKP